MKKLKIILLFSTLLIAIRTNYIVTNKIVKTKLNENITEIKGTLIDYKISDTYITLTLKSIEKIKVTYYTEEEFDLELGATYNVLGTIESPIGNTIFNQFNYKNYLLSNNIKWIFKASSIKKSSNNKNILYLIKNNIIKRIDKYKTKDYLNLFILGKNNLDGNIKLTYKNNGISHLFAISGMHISLLSSVILKILNKFFKNKKLNIIITILFLIFYLFLTNYTPSVIRATFLFIILETLKLIKIKINSLYVLIIILDTLLLINPYYIYNIGFVFSFLISGSLIITNKIISSYKNYISKLFITSLISFIVCIPFQINNNFEINLLTSFINILFVPLVSIIIFPLTLLTFVIKPLDNMLSSAVTLLENISNLIDSIPSKIILCHINIYIFIIYCLIIIFIIYKIKKHNFKPIIILLIIIFVHHNILYLKNYNEITFIDVGQGDSTLLELKNNQANILIDTGGKEQDNNTNYIGNNIIMYLKSIGINKIKYLILTHGDADHMKESLYIIDNFKIENVILNSGTNTYLENKLIEKLKYKNINYLKINKYKLKLKGITLEFINDQDMQNENEDSLIIYTKINNKNILLMGDAGFDSEKYIAKTYNLPKMDIIKIGHHGSKYSSSYEFLNKIKPSISIISVGIKNNFNHPSKEVISNLKNINSKIYQTSIYGTIKIKLKNTIEIYTCNKPATQ